MHMYALSVADIQQGGVFYMNMEIQRVFLNRKIQSFQDTGLFGLTVESFMTSSGSSGNAS